MLSFLIIIVIIVSLAIFLFRDKITSIFESLCVFHPDKNMDKVPSGIQEIFFETPDKIVLYAWYSKVKKSKDTILYCHGNAGNISSRIYAIKIFNELGYDVFAFDYRGYGHSNGHPSELGLYIDVETSYKWLISSGVSKKHIIGYGESLGGAVIIDLATKQKMKAIILLCTFTSGDNMVRKYLKGYNIIRYNGFNSIDKIKQITIPKLIFSSKDDEIVSYSMGQELFSSAPDPKKFVPLNGGHNECFYNSKELIGHEIHQFIEEI